MSAAVLVERPVGVFRGKNFMTPEPLEFYRRTLYGRTVYVEISEGTGFDREPIYGVTFRWSDGTELWRNGGHDPSAMFNSLGDARNHAKKGGA